MSPQLGQSGGLTSLVGVLQRVKEALQIPVLALVDSGSGEPPCSSAPAVCRDSCARFAYCVTAPDAGCAAAPGATRGGLGTSSTRRFGRQGPGPAPRRARTSNCARAEAARLCFSLTDINSLNCKIEIEGGFFLR